MRSVTFNVSFPRPLLRHLDAVAKQQARSRSELLRESARQYVERCQQWERVMSFWRGEAKRRGMTPADVEKAIQDVRRPSRQS